MSPRAEKLSRRLLTVSIYLALAITSVATAPVWIVLCALIDAFRRRKLASLRCGSLFTLLFCCEAAGILASAWIWLSAGPWRSDQAERYLDLNYRLQWWWASTLFEGASLVFGMRVHVSGEDDTSATPLLLFARHASIIDTILPVVLVSARHEIRLRYVLKRELLWDPSLDIVGNRTPNHFVDRTPDDSASEIDAVGRLADSLGRGEGAVIFPEGTRYSSAKRAQVIERLRTRGLVAEAERAERLLHVLPPRPGGPLALIAHAPDADVVFCSHTGLEGAARLSDLWAGELIGAQVHVHFWRVPAAEIPPDPDAQREWLFAQWESVNAWVGENS